TRPPSLRDLTGGREARWGYPAAGGAALAWARGQRGPGGLRRHLRVRDLAEPLDQPLPLLGLEDLRELLELAGLGEGVADVDVVPVVGQDEGRRPQVHQRDDLG